MDWGFYRRGFGGKGFEKNGFEFGWDAWGRWIWRLIDG